jgi:hypothetical protein
MIEITNNASPFGIGLSNKTLVLEAIRNREVTAMLVLVFVEEVLGYELRSDTSARDGTWEFRRLSAFIG